MKIRSLKMIKVWVPSYFGVTRDSDDSYFGKRVKKSFYLEINLGQKINPSFDIQSEYNGYKSMIGKQIMLGTNKKPVTIKGINKSILPVGFGGALAYELCYV